jgi:hypothetical protein
LALRSATRGFDGHRHSVGVFDRALDRHGGRTMMRLEEASGLRHAVAQEPRLIDLSLGGAGRPSVIKTARPFPSSTTSPRTYLAAPPVRDIKSSSARSRYCRPLCTTLGSTITCGYRIGAGRRPASAKIFSQRERAVPETYGPRSFGGGSAL